MATAAPAQDYANHRKFVRGFHLVALPILLINLIYSSSGLIRSFSWESVIGALVAVALILVAFYARIFALGAQDRVIRLEEQMRLHELLPGQRADVDNMRLAIEAKSSARITRDHLKGLRSLAEDHPGVKSRIVVCREPRARRTEDGIEVLPVATFVRRLWDGDFD